MKLKEMISLFKDAATEGVQYAIAQTSQVSESISKSEAYRRYGRASVDRWLSEGLLKPLPENGGKSTDRIDTQELEATAASSNRQTYLPVAER